MTYPTASARARNRPARVAFGIWFVVLLLPVTTFAVVAGTLRPGDADVMPIVVVGAAIAIALVASLAAIALSVRAVRQRESPRTLAVWALVLNIVFCPIVTFGFVVLFFAASW